MPIYRMRCEECCSEQDIFRTVAQIDHDLPLCCGKTTARRPMPAMVIADISPYQAVAVDVATGKPPVITSRSAHRDFLRRNNYVEVGNEMPDMSKRQVEGDFNVRRELADATHEVLSRHRA